MSGLAPDQAAFLAAGVRSLARIATVDSQGRPHVVPGGWAWDPAAEELLLTGRNVPTTARAAHVRATGVAAVTIDGVREDGGWAPWALLLRGAAEVDDERGLIRLSPSWSRSWGLDEVRRR